MHRQNEEPKDPVAPPVEPDHGVEPPLQAPDVPEDPAST